MPLISKKIANEYDVLVRMHVKVFLDRRDWKKTASKFLCRLAIRGEIGLCCNVKPMKQVGIAAPITS
jgi:hypothetical protein